MYDWFKDRDSVSQAGEETLIRILHKLSSSSPEVLVGNGDDAAVLRSLGSTLISTVDAQVEGVHFERSWLSPHQCGLRAFRVAASDVVAMGYRPQWTLLSLGLPSDLSVRAFESLATGFVAGCDEAKTSLIGGNITRNKVLSMHVTVFANPKTRHDPWTRDGAKPGDRLWVTGPCGGAAGGLALLQANVPEDDLFTSLLSRWRSPAHHWNLVPELRTDGLVRACMDLSDGLLLDSRRMAQASSVRLVLEASAIPRDVALEKAAAFLNTDPMRWIIGGGEDYQLLVAARGEPPQWAQDAGVRAIGHVEEGDSEVVILNEGHPLNLEALVSGWDPF
jgi:thiamine-monophosphate kinase